MIFHLWLNCLQQKLFPALESELGTLSPKETEFVRIVEFCQLHTLMTTYEWKGNGRKPLSRLALAKSFVAKMVWNLPTTEALISFLHAAPNTRRLCGWEAKNDIPDRATFSRAFEQFAIGQLPQLAQSQIIKTHLGDRIIGHISIDATAISARESVAKKEPPADPAPSKNTKKTRGRPRKDEVRPPAPEKRLDLQLSRSLEENIFDLPSFCDRGCKRNSQGYKETWNGYKLHIASTDFDIPICSILSTASLHDSQAAIPLMQKCKTLIKNSLYDLCDAAYDAPQIHEFSRSLGHVPIIDPNPRRSSNPRTLDPHEKSRFKERSSVERVNSNLKDNWGGRFVRVRGAAKVACHLFFGLLALTADRLISILP
jgi:Transposase DDE domain